MKEALLTTPVLFTIFNRPDVTRQVFAEIKKARPSKLFIAGDGPRPTRPDDARLCEEARSIIRDIDWTCELHTLFREKNLGCMKGMVGAIDWFFEHVEEGIVLEDDVLPHQDFFRYCEIMLKKYRNEPNVFMIGGTNYYRDHAPVHTSYFFSYYCPMWGWAGWRRWWKHYTISMEDFDRGKINHLIKERYHNKAISAHYDYIWDLYTVFHLDSWDTQYVYRFTLLNGLTIMPRRNLVSNIGIVGTHTSKKYGIQFLPLFPFDSKSIIHPDKAEVDPVTDKKVFLDIIKASEPSVLGRIKRSIKKILKHFFRS